ncbi:hypothetical protein DXG03_006024 [Asterophora parasitica]|uniref:Uncharacterized protein n=1 Tax=Asterophora parasitica TaxID=117018 RepID=A0A9P7KDN0_9AGAR|nr:hypothetical protein DXG03_006024 [Asterophora parasitica]
MAGTNREPSFIGGGDAISRSITRGSHYSRASTQSWVRANHQNPPPPPEDSIPIHTPTRTPTPTRTLRPLPDPQLQSQRQSVLRATNADPPSPEDGDDEEFMNIDPNGPEMATGYLTEGLGRGRSPRPAPTIPNSSRAGTGEGGRSFVGGFFNGLRRLPRTVMKYGSGEKRVFSRRGTFGSGGTVTSATGMTTGNTLPLYVSNPPTPIAGPSNTRYVEAPGMPVPLPFPAEDPRPLIVGPSLSQRRRNPSFRITPPSEEVIAQTNLAEPQNPPTAPPQFTENLVESPRNANTVTIYHLPGQEDYPVDGPPLPLPSPTPNRRSDLSHQQQPISPIPAEEPLPSPVLAHPHPTPDYRKMTLSSSPRTRATSLTSEPSFSSELNPVKRFFLGLYHLPWIAPERVTTDYHPRGHGRQHRERRSAAKKSMASWYRGTPGAVISAKPGSGEVDLLSSGTRSRLASARTSYTPLSPTSARSRHWTSNKHGHRHRDDHRNRGHRQRSSGENTPRSHEYRSHRRRNTFSTVDMQPQHTASPIIPAVYPFPYPYSYQYPAFSPPPPQRAYSQNTPRGPRPHRTETYPHGYAPYQPAQPSPPVYVIHSPAQANGSGEAGQVLTPVYMPMQLVPGAFHQEPSTGWSPPTVERPVGTQTVVT